MAALMEKGDMTTLIENTTPKSNFWKTPVLGSFAFWLWRLDAKRKLRRLQKHLKYLDQHIEIGSGTGSVLSVMRKQNYYVDGLDFADNSFHEDLKPIVYNGRMMPFAKDVYDTALLLTVLHYTEDPEGILREAGRIAKRIVVIENVYDRRVMEWLTKGFCSLMNFEFIGHPHNNRTHAQWIETFEKMDLKLWHKSTYRVGGIFKQAIYVLKVEEAA